MGAAAGRGGAEGVGGGGGGVGGGGGGGGGRAGGGGWGRRERGGEGGYLGCEGFVIHRSEGLSIDNGTEALLLVTDQPLTPAQRVRAGGICKSSRLYAERIETVPVSAADLRERLKNL